VETISVILWVSAARNGFRWWTSTPLGRQRGGKCSTQIRRRHPSLVENHTRRRRMGLNVAGTFRQTAQRFFARQLFPIALVSRHGAAGTTMV
jgi:hypothetical protein